MIGSIFHPGHRIVKDSRKGIFDRERAEELIRTQEALSEKTGNPHMVDVVGETSEALKRYIDFASDVTEAPILINGPSADVRLEASRHAASIGLEERAVYNSINCKVTLEETTALAETGVKAAIVQAFNPRNPWLDGMRQQLVGASGTPGLLEAASKSCVEKPLILTPVLDIPSIGVASRAVYVLKDELGLPTGTAPIGAVARWRKAREFEQSSKRLIRAAAAALAQSMGADFIIYGSLERAMDVFPACAMTDAMIAYNAAAEGIRPLTRNHPLYRIL